MKAQELRIGNLLFDRGDKILRLDYWDFMKPAQRMFLGDSELHPLTEDLEYCKPIPLTEEWLFKFGFIDLKERCGLNGIYSIIGKQIHINIETNSYCQIDYEGSVCDIVKIEYVHELQNLFYALNKEELTYGGNK
jgi:hypothetical protein